MKNHYQILGLKSGATLKEIKNAYRKLAAKFHPDKNDGDEFFLDMFKKIQESYEILSNEVNRKLYDDAFASYIQGGLSNHIPLKTGAVDQSNRTGDSKNSTSGVGFAIIGAILIIFIIFLIKKEMQPAKETITINGENYLNSQDKIYRDNDSLASIATDAAVTPIYASESSQEAEDSYKATESTTRQERVLEIRESTEKDALGFLEDYYSFYQRDKRFRNPIFKRISYNSFEISVEECNKNYTDDDIYYNSALFILNIKNDDYEMIPR